MPAYTAELPPAYREVFSIDATTHDRLPKIVNRVSAVFSIVSTLLLLFLSGIPHIVAEDRTVASSYLIGFLIWFAAYFAYIICHELLHGVVYRVLTHHKLTFGIHFPVAFCGVPDIYVNRRTAILSTAAPFVIFCVILIPLSVISYFISPVFFFFTLLMLFSHVGGCCFDLVLIWLFLFRFRSPEALMRDTGPVQKIYLPESEK